MLQEGAGQLRAADCFRRGWSLIRDQYILFAALTLAGVYIGNLTLLLATGPMLAGIFICFLDRYDGREIRFERLFGGFRFFFRSVGIMLLFVIPVLIVVLTVTIPFLTSIANDPDLTERELYARIATALGIEVVLALAMTCLHSLLLFSFPLLVDRDLSFGQCVLTSARAVWQNLSLVTGLFGYGFLLTIAGLLAFCVGIYLVLPVIIAANVVAYRSIFPAR